MMMMIKLTNVVIKASTLMNYSDVDENNSESDVDDDDDDDDYGRPHTGQLARQGRCSSAGREGRGRLAPMPLRLEVSGVQPPSGGHSSSSTKVFSHFSGLFQLKVIWHEGITFILQCIGNFILSLHSNNENYELTFNNIQFLRGAFELVL